MRGEGEGVGVGVGEGVGECASKGVGSRERARLLRRVDSGA